MWKIILNSFIICSFILFFLDFLCYKGTIKDIAANKVKLTIKDLKKLYKINPNKWQVEIISKILYYATNKGPIYIDFNFFQYLWFIYHCKFPKDNRKNDENMVVLLEDCQKDIDLIREKAKSQIQEGKEMTDEVMERLLQERDF